MARKATDSSYRYPNYWCWNWTENWGYFGSKVRKVGIDLIVSGKPIVIYGLITYSRPSPQTPPVLQISLLPLSPLFTKLRNTLMAVTTCPEGDYWTFVQDSNGNIRGAQLSPLTSVWNVTSLYYNFTNVRPNSELTASCVNIPDDENEATLLKAGKYISIIYLNESDALQQTILDGGTWSNSPVFPAGVPPHNNTKISNTVVGPQGIYSEQQNVIYYYPFSSYTTYQ